MTVNQKNIFGSNNFLRANKIIWKARAEGFIFGITSAIILGIISNLIWELIIKTWNQ